MKVKLLPCLVVGSLILAAFGCAGPSGPSPEEVRAAVEGADQAFMDAFASGDAAAIAALYTADATLLPPYREEVTGTAAIEEFWAEVMSVGADEVILDIGELLTADDMTVEIGRYSLSSSGVTLDEGKYLVLWKWTDEGLRLHRDIWNSSWPAPVGEDALDAP